MAQEQGQHGKRSLPASVSGPHSLEPSPSKPASAAVPACHVGQPAKRRLPQSLTAEGSSRQQAGAAARPAKRSRTSPARTSTSHRQQVHAAPAAPAAAATVTTAGRGAGAPRADGAKGSEGAPASSESDTAQRALSGLHVYLHSSIPMLKSRAALLSAKLRALGARVSVAPLPGTRPSSSSASASTSSGSSLSMGAPAERPITHVVVGPGYTPSVAELHSLTDTTLLTGLTVPSQPGTPGRGVSGRLSGLSEPPGTTPPPSPPAGTAATQRGARVTEQASARSGDSAPHSSASAPHTTVQVKHAGGVAGGLNRGLAQPTPQQPTPQEKARDPLTSRTPRPATAYEPGGARAQLKAGVVQAARPAGAASSSAAAAEGVHEQQDGSGSHGGHAGSESQMGRGAGSDSEGAATSSAPTPSGSGGGTPRDHTGTPPVAVSLRSPALRRKASDLVVAPQQGASQQLPKVVEVAWVEAILSSRAKQPSAPYQVQLAESSMDGHEGDHGVTSCLSLLSSGAAGAAGKALLGPQPGAGQAGLAASAGALSKPPKGLAATRAAMGKGALPVYRGYPVGDAACRPARGARLGRFARWLGYWHPRLDEVDKLPELMLWPKYNIERSEVLGNEKVVALLIELMKYEEAIGGTKGDPGDDNVNHRSLSYAHAAAAVRACAFPLATLVQAGAVRQGSREISDSSQPDDLLAQSPAPNQTETAVLAKQLSKLLPYLGSTYISGVVAELLLAGTCDKLERFRHDEVVTDSRGAVRHDTVGASTRRQFCRLPGVGPASAWTFWQAGCRDLHKVEDWLRSQVEHAEQQQQAKRQARSQHTSAALTPSRLGAGHASRGDSDAETDGQSVDGDDADGALAGGGKGGARSARSVRGAVEMLYSTVYRDDLLTPLPAADAAEMREALLAALREVTGVDGWQLVTVGGGRRSKHAHDADFLATHPTHPVEGVVGKLYDLLVSRGQLVPKEVAFCRLQKDHNQGYLDRARRDVADDKWAYRHQMDRYDHIFGLWVTAAGKRRRMDIIFVPQATWVFGLVGWTGSKQLLRFMRAHAGDLRMRLNSHALLRMNPAGSHLPAVLVPQEAGPLNRQGDEEWPPGWVTPQGEPVRHVSTEAQLSDLLGVPCWDPTDRNCP